MDQDDARPTGQGATQSGLRAHNERLLLSTIRRRGPMPGSELAREVGLSAQTVSIILRDLEGVGLLARGEPQRGRVGKPSIPMTLAADGAFSVGLKIGRRSADLALMDLHGKVRGQLGLTYRYPLPDQIFGFLRLGLDQLSGTLPRRLVPRICGIGLAAPFEIWKWHEVVGAPAETFRVWRDIDFAAEVARFSDLPVSVVNDATAACRAEQVFGRGPAFRDWAYVFVGAFIGGGVVLNGTVYEGARGNAGALGSLRSVNARGENVQLIDTASLHLLEARLAAAGKDPGGLWARPQDWTPYAAETDAWIAEAGPEIAKAALSACAVIDFEAVLIDGAFPPEVRRRLVQEVERHVAGLDSRGLIVPRIEAGSVGVNARVIGAAYGPISSQYFLAPGPALAG
ncbi:MAG: ROK family transcriptional regulator [Rhodobacterales bacterium]|nr:ROK family transcriptional regulator [Rhodobacterales bacterium]